MFRQVVSGRWQVPLLVLASISLAMGILRLRPEQPVLSFDETLERVVMLRRGELYDFALDELDRLEQAEGRTRAEMHRIERVRAETIYFQQLVAQAPSPAQARLVVAGYTDSEAGGVPLTPIDAQRLGRAYEWMGWRPQAVRAYRRALEGDLDRPLDLRRRVIELMLRDEEREPAALHDAVDALLAAAEASPDHLLWALQQKLALLDADGKYEESLALVERLRDALARSTARDEADYLHALELFHLSRYDDADRELRLLRDRLNLSESLHARTGWLLGELNLRDERPQAALAFFRDVLRNHDRGEYWAAARLGEAAALAWLRRFDESLDAFERVIAQLPRYRGSSVLNPVAVRTALTTLGKTLGAQLTEEEDKLDRVLQFTQLAASLVQPDEAHLEAQMAGQMAELYASLARWKQVVAARVKGPESAAMREQLLGESQRYFLQAGDEYRRWARLLTLDDTAAAGAAWEAIEMYDQAGRTDRHIGSLREFILERPGDIRIPEARFRLGRAHQVLGEYEQAIEQFQRNQEAHSRTPAGVRSRVEMGAAHIALGPSNYAEAERILLGIVDEPVGSDRLLTPSAPEFRDALFGLAELYEKQGRQEKVIARLEEMLTRYPNDVRSTRTRFLLADAYRHSATALRAAMDKATGTTQRDRIDAERNRRLARSADLYGQVVTAYDAKPLAALSGLETLYLELAVLYRADCVFDRGQYDHALALYEEAAWKYERVPAALAAYTQMISCQQRLGRSAAALRLVHRARTLVKRMPEAAFDLLARPDDGATGGIAPVGRTRGQWDTYFQGLASTTLLRSPGV